MFFSTKVKVTGKSTSEGYVTLSHNMGKYTPGFQFSAGIKRIILYEALLDLRGCVFWSLQQLSRTQCLYLAFYIRGIVWFGLEIDVPCLHELTPKRWFQKARSVFVHAGLTVKVSAVSHLDMYENTTLHHLHRHTGLTLGIKGERREKSN